MMATHYFLCDNCGFHLEDDNLKEHQCPQCKQGMRIEWPSYRKACGDYNFVSASLAINPSQAAAHRKLFPNVGVLPDGRLEFKSVRSHDKYLEATGFVKHPQKIKRRGVRIA